MNLSYTNYLENYNDLDAEISYIIENEISDYIYLRLEIIVYIENEKPLIFNATSFNQPLKYIQSKIYSYLDVFEIINEISDKDIQGCLVNLYLK